MHTDAIREGLWLVKHVIYAYVLYSRDIYEDIDVYLSIYPCCYFLFCVCIDKRTLHVPLLASISRMWYSYPQMPTYAYMSTLTQYVDTLQDPVTVQYKCDFIFFTAMHLAFKRDRAIAAAGGKSRFYARM